MKSQSTKMSVDERTGDEMLVSDMSVVEISFNKMSVDEMTRPQ